MRPGPASLVELQSGVCQGKGIVDRLDVGDDREVRHQLAGLDFDLFGELVASLRG